MSTLAMILTAAMVVPGDGSRAEKVSMEMVQELDMSGEWEGTAHNSASKSKEKINISRGHADLQFQGSAIRVPLKIIAEGEGKLRIEVNVAGTVRKILGIYKWQGDHLVICSRPEGKGRPRSFMVDGVTSLLILQRVKPRK